MLCEATFAVIKLTFKVEMICFFDHDQCSMPMIYELISGVCDPNGESGYLRDLWLFQWRIQTIRQGWAERRVA